VFIDPPETGFSQLLAGVPVTTFRSIDADSYAVSQIILRWLVDNGRLDSPKYLAGESYGTLRAVALARDLARATPKIQLDGFDDLGLEPSAPLDWIAGLCLGHSDTPARPRASGRSP
jgi:carboxypeptidase C (cathepsin A)